MNNYFIALNGIEILITLFDAKEQEHIIIFFKNSSKYHSFKLSGNGKYELWYGFQEPLTYVPLKSECVR